MNKDFLFFTYSWVKNANIIFNQFAQDGYLCDFVDETNISTFKPNHQYKNIVLYLHEPNTIPITNYLIDTFYKYSNLIQHDDTDEEHVQKWTNRKPDLIFQRELTEDTRNIWNTTLCPMHFAVESIYEDKQKIYDVSFIGTLTNPRRLPFIEKLLDLSKKRKDLNWFIDVAARDTRTPVKFRDIANQSKIGLHYYGNSYDSLRIWELASCKTAILMPKMKNLSVRKEFMEFTNYEIFKDDLSDLEYRIDLLLEKDRYKEVGLSSHISFLQDHNPFKCYEYYHSKLKENGLI